MSSKRYLSRKKMLIEDLIDFCDYNHRLGHKCKFCLCFLREILLYFSIFIWYGLKPEQLEEGAVQHALRVCLQITY